MSDPEGEQGASGDERARARYAEIAAQAYLDLADVIFVAIGPDQRVLLINRKGCEMLGYSEAEILGKPWLETFIPERFHAQMRPLFKELIAGRIEPMERYENPILTRGGEERIIEWHNALLRDEGGVIRASLSAGLDITERHRSQSTLQSFYDNAPYVMGICELFEDDIRIVSGNTALAAFYGRPLAELVGRRLSELDVSEKSRLDVVEKYWEAHRERKPVRFMFRREGRPPQRSLQVTVSPLAMAPDGTPMFSFITEDVTDREEMQARLLLSDRMSSLGTLAAGVAHEINNPLAYVATNLDIIASYISSPSASRTKGPGEGDLTRAVTQAREGVARVREIVKGLRTFSRGDEDRREPIRLEDVIESSLKMVWNEIRHRAELVRDYSGAPPVLANEARLGQLFLNLLVNAAHAIPEGHASSNTIRVTTRTDAQGRVIAEVTDTGSGISPEIIDRIFEPFFTTRPVGAGTGLGLSVCHGIVQALGGEITVDSEIGKGSTFRVVLPAAPSEAQRMPSKPAPPPVARRGRVLIIDDEPLLRMSLRSLLGAEHDVTTASSAREVLTKIGAGGRFDVLLCDLMMPEMTGMDLFDRLQKDAPDQADRMVFLTGGVFTTRAQSFLDRVSNPCLEKPFDLNGLRAVIQKLLK